MARKKEADVVFFNDANGNKVSNDPRWLAKQTLATMEDTVDDPEVNSVTQGVDDPSDYDNWSGNKLKAEVKDRREAGREVQPEGKTKQDFVDALKLDDAQQAADVDDEDEESEDEDNE